MPFHSFFADGEAAGNFAVAVPLFNSRDNFDLACSESEAAGRRLSSARPGCNRFAAHPELAFADGANALKQELGGRSLEYDPARAQLQGAGDGERLDRGRE